jgi:hypothetical protein
MNADHEEAVEFAKISKRENRVYVGNLSYDVKYRDLMEFMRGGGWGNPFFERLSRVGGAKKLWPGCGCAVVGEYPWGRGCGGSEELFEVLGPERVFFFWFFD